MSRVLVVGGGAWGTALALQAHRAGREVALWTRTGWVGRESAHLPGFPLPEGVRLTRSFEGGADLVVLAVPVQHLRGVLGLVQGDAPLLVCCKGVEAGTSMLPLEVVEAVRPGAAGVLTGPNFAHEVAAGLPAAAVVAAGDAGLRAVLAGLMGSGTFRLYGNEDVVGAQLGGAAKNVMAIAAGAVMGAGLGENARAALITRGLAELGRLVVAQGGRAETVAGLSGLGDLLLTCTGGASRNYRCGLGLGRGERLEAVLAGMGGVVEGVATAPALLARAGGVGLPVCGAVVDLLAGRVTLAEAIADLMGRPVRDE